jgi:hypothetical protein
LLIPNLVINIKQNPFIVYKNYKTESVVSQNIRQFNVYENGLIIAGTTVLKVKMLCIAIYSGKIRQNDLGGLDVLHYIDRCDI